MMKYTPVKLSPVFKDYLWGGEKLRTEYRKNTDLTPLAESWELSAHRDGESTISGGRYDGYTLTEYVEAIGRDALGTKARAFDYFPLLIKFIDAKGDLSVQVHPDDTYAMANEGEYGKTEMWYVLDCEEAALCYGFRRDITKEEYRAAIENETLTDLLLRVPVKKGDVFFIPAGTVHAIGAGIVICEIQQNSNTTYRVYDYGRRDKNGNLRPLHIKKALEVSTLTKAPERPVIPQHGDALLASCDYFTVSRRTVDGTAMLRTDTDSFRALVVTDGSGELRCGNETLPVDKGDTVFLPAQDATVALCGNFDAIVASL